MLKFGTGFFSLNLFTVLKRLKKVQTYNLRHSHLAKLKPPFVILIDKLFQSLLLGNNTIRVSPGIKKRPLQ